MFLIHCINYIHNWLQDDDNINKQYESSLINNSGSRGLYDNNNNNNNMAIILL